MPARVIPDFGFSEQVEDAASFLAVARVEFVKAPGEREEQAEVAVRVRITGIASVHGQQDGRIFPALRKISTA